MVLTDVALKKARHEKQSRMSYVAHLRALGRAEATIAKTEWLMAFVGPLNGKAIREVAPADILPILENLQA